MPAITTIYPATSAQASSISSVQAAIAQATAAIADLEAAIAAAEEASTNLDLGTISSQDANNVTITGGTASGLTSVEATTYNINGVVHIQQKGSTTGNARVTNIGVGYQALDSHSASSTKLGNNAFGYKTMQYGTDTQENTGVGYQAGQYAQGSYNVYVGYKAGNGSVLELAGTNTATGNTAVGSSALRSADTADYCAAFGRYANYNNASGDYTTAIGAYSLYNHTGGNYNTAISSYSLYGLTTGTEHVAIGMFASYTVTTASYSTAIGYGALQIATGAKNTAIGHSAGSGITSGQYNVIIGSGTGSSAPISATGSGYIVFYDGQANFRAQFDTSGNLGVGTSGALTAKCDINGDMIRLRSAKTPASAAASGNAGEICWDSTYVYVCVGTNTWKRSAIATW